MPPFRMLVLFFGGGGQFLGTKENKNATGKDLESRASEVLELPDVSPKING